MNVLLASGSPRRAKILDGLGVAFEIVRTDAPEVSRPGEPERTVLENALAKGAAARRCLDAADARPVLSADTIVWLDGKIYGKPRDRDEARAFLRELSGRTHYVFTGVALDGAACVQTSAVTFRNLTDGDIGRYLELVNPLDRAGAYDIGTEGDLLVGSCTGSHENIMGLPVEPLVAWGVAGRSGSARMPRPAGRAGTGGSNAPREPSSAPVGFFDSGLGGLCILDAFKRLCPDEPTVYLADSANCPYGSRPPEDILRLSRANVRKLREAFGCKLIVVACNTATAAAIDALRRDDPDFPFVGIEPALKPAALQSETGVVGVLATEGTFGGRLYNETKAKFAKEIEVVAAVADEWVGLVERRGLAAVRCRPPEGVPASGGAWPADAERIVRARIEPLLAADCDRLVLGCTHFPHLKPLIEKIAAGRAVVVDPSEAVARQARRVLSGRGLRASSPNPPHVFLSTRARPDI